MGIIAIALAIVVLGALLAAGVYFVIRMASRPRSKGDWGR